MVSEASALAPSPLEVPSEGTHHRKGRILLRPGTESSNPSPSGGESANFWFLSGGADHGRMRPACNLASVRWGNAAHSEVDRCERIFGDDHAL